MAVFTDDQCRCCTVDGFTDFSKKHLPAVFAYLSKALGGRKGRHRQSAHELTDEALLRMLRRLKDEKKARIDPGDWLRYLFRIASNLVEDQDRYEMRNKERVGLDETLDAGFVEGHDGGLPPIGEDQRAEIRALLESLNDVEIETLVLAKCCDLPTWKIAEILGESDAATRRRLHRTIRALGGRRPESSR